MNSNYNIMPAQFIPPPVVQYIPPNFRVIPAYPILTDPYGRIYPRLIVHNVFYLGRCITTIVTRHPAVIHEWISDIYRFYFHHINSLVVGLGIEWPHHTISSDRRPAVIQLCIGQHCIIFQLRRAPGIPSSLYGFLSDPNITFVGFRMDLIRWKLQSHWGLVVQRAADIQILAEWRTGLRETIPILIARFLGFSFAWGPYEFGWSQWDQRELSLEQVTFACSVAYLACQLGVRILYTGV